MNNNYNPTTYTGTSYGTTEDSTASTTNSTAVPANEAPLSRDELEGFFKDWLDKTITQSHNLSEQGKILKEKHNQNISLTQENKVLRDKIAELEAQLNAPTNVQQSFDGSVQDTINNLNNRLNEFEKQDKLRKMEPLIELVKSYNVPRTDVDKIWSGIEAEYGVNIVSNPNEKLVKAYLEENYGKSTEASIPQGGYTSKPNPVQFDEEAYQKRKNEYVNALYSNAIAKKNSNKVF